MARRKTKEEWKIMGNVFDQFTNRLIFRLSSQGHFAELEQAYRMGKEANVFIARKTDGSKVIVKIYRLENCNFNKMQEYLMQDERYQDIKGQRRKTIFAWVQREFRNLMLAREVIRVPTPIAFKDNIIIMEMIGDDEPAQELKDDTPKNIEEFYGKIIENMEKLKKAGLVHGDLSAFNILNYDQEPIFIDFSQGTTTDSEQSEELYARDLEIINKYFKKIGMKTNS